MLLNREKVYGPGPDGSVYVGEGEGELGLEGLSCLLSLWAPVEGASSLLSSRA